MSFRLRAAADEVLVHTGQHYDADLSQVFFDELQLPRPEHHLDLGGGSNTEQTGRMLQALGPLLEAEAPDVILVYGDTNSTLAGALAGAQARIPVAHVEAGMRSFDRSMPEELNRVLTDHASDLLLCPAAGPAEHLRAEGVQGEVVVVGDVMVDVAQLLAPRARERTSVLEACGVDEGEYLLATAHRAGNVDDVGRLERLVELLTGLGDPVVLPLHPRTRARLEAAGLLADLEADPGVRLVAPLGYLDFTALLLHARAVLTDSGGVQKEAYLAGVPCITLRDRTEWTETVQTGWNVLVGLDADAARAALARDLPALASAVVRRRPSGRARRAGAARAARAGDGMSLRIGVAGLGYWGPNLARNFAAIEGCELTWCCDASEEARVRWQPSFPSARFTADLDDLLNDPELDAVVLATPVPSHGPLAERVLGAGKHCFVEKPLAQSVAEAERAVAAAERTGRVLMVGHLLEYHPGVAKLKEIAVSGELGDIHYVYSNRLNLGKLRADENALWSLGAHDVSVVLHLADEEPYELTARGESYMRPGIEDVVFGFMRFPSGLAAHLHLSWLDPHKERRFTIVGSRKMATFDDMDIERKVTVYDKGFDELAGSSYGEYITRAGDIYSPRIPNREPLRLECEHFVECLRTGEPPRSDGAAGLRVVRVLEGLQEALDASRRERDV